MAGDPYRNAPAPFSVDARGERRSVPAGKSTLWAAIRVAATARPLERERAPLALVLVIDVSGSMKGDPIAQVVRSCELVAELLEPRDRLAIVTFADHAGVRCGLTALDDAGRATIAAALREVVADGSTNMEAGIAAGAGLLAAAPAELRRAIVVLSDGQPNRGVSSPDQLGAFVRTLRPIGVSTLGFGLHHDEKVLAAVATAGSGRYAYVPDPIGARVDLARAALAHGGIVADSLELRVKPAAGVEIVRFLPNVPLRHRGDGMVAAIGDVFVDENRLVAVELALDLGANARGELVELAVSGRSPDGATHEISARLVVDVHAGPHAIASDAQRDVLIVRGEAMRAEAIAQADRGAMPAAVSLLRAIVDQIDASEGFVANDGSPLAELREQLLDEIANYQRNASDAERTHQRKASTAYPVQVAKPAKHGVRAPGVLVGEDGSRHPLFVVTQIGRSTTCEMPIQDNSLSRVHARVMYVDGQFVLNDLGSTNGCYVNGRAVFAERAAITPGDVVQLGFVKFRLEADK